MSLNRTTKREKKQTGSSRLERKENKGAESSKQKKRKEGESGCIYPKEHVWNKTLFCPMKEE